MRLAGCSHSASEWFCFHQTEMTINAGLILRNILQLKKQFLLIQSTPRILKYTIHTLKTPVFEARRKETVMYKSV